MKAFDKDGNEIDVFSQEELDAKVKEIADAQATADADAKAKADADAAAAASKNDEVPEWAKQIIAKVENLSSNNTMSYIDKVTGGVDADKKKIISEKFASLTAGYDDTPEGMSRRAEDAYLLATGEKFNANVVNINNLAAAGGGRTQTDVKAVTEADKAVQGALGITAADVEKFGKK